MESTNRVTTVRYPRMRGWGAFAPIPSIGETFTVANGAFNILPPRKGTSIWWLNHYLRDLAHNLRHFSAECAIATNVGMRVYDDGLPKGW